jgi:hypothetical protein
MQMLLKDNKRWNIMSKAYVKPTSNFVDWEKRDRKAKTIIVMGLHDFLLQNVIGTKRTKETWDCLLKVYETKGLANKLFLK